MNRVVVTKLQHCVEKTPGSGSGSSSGAADSFDPATVEVVLKDFSTATLTVTDVLGPKKLELDFADNLNFGPEDIISVSQRCTCPAAESASGSASASASSVVI